MTSASTTRLHFVLRNESRERWHDVLAGHVPAILDLRQRIVNTEDVWIVLTYLHYRHRGWQVSIDTVPVADKINVIDGALTRHRDFRSRFFYVTCRCDGPFPAMGHAVLHQNVLGSGRRNEIQVFQWPQPGLIKRDSSRGNDVRTLAFFGHTRKNLSARFRSEEFLSELAQRGIEFQIKGKAETNVEWHDYANVDVVMAVRDDIVGDAVMRLKPVNKVTNAWLAGALCITGREPAVSAAFPSCEATLFASSVAEALSVIDRLRDNPDLFAKLSNQGSRLAEAYAEDAIMANWVAMEQEITPVFEKWQTKKEWQRWLSYIGRSAAHYATRFAWKLARH